MTEPRPLLAFAPAVTGPIPTGPPRFMPGPRTPTAEPDLELVAVCDVASTVEFAFVVVTHLARGSARGRYRGKRPGAYGPPVPGNYTI